MKKLKELRSMELQFFDDGTLATKEGTRLFRISPTNAYDTGDILEIRFSIKDSLIQIHEVFGRPDKKTANDNSAIDSIIDSSIEFKLDSMIRTSIWRWSNMLRFHMYQRIEKLDPSRNIVLDIGSGSVQSSEAFEKLPGCSFILIEPDQKKCKSLCKRLSAKQYYTDARSLIPAISQLKKGTRKYHILNTTLEMVLNDKPVLANIKDTVKCAIACFSAQFIIGSLDFLASIKVPFIGCYYSYHDIDVSKSIINTNGIQMTRASECEAHVKWGTDEGYFEPVVDEDNLPFSVSTIDAIEMVDASTYNRIKLAMFNLVSVARSIHNG